MRLSHNHLALLIVLSIMLGLVIDEKAGTWGQPLVNIWVWFLYILLLACSSQQKRLELITCLVFATLGEIILSLLWGVYVYRMNNIPLFVPPGHALLYTLGCIYAIRMPHRFPVYIGIAAALGAAGLAMTGLDLIDFFLTLVFIAALCWGSKPQLYALMYVIALILELWGTWLGNWYWPAKDPIFGLTTLNPPLAAGAFYSILYLLVENTTRLSQKLFRN